jgi:rhamnogalacturonyl hydrolase YesR
MKIFACLLLIAMFLYKTGYSQPQKILPANLVESVINKGIHEIDLGYYPGSLLVHGMAEYALLEPSGAALNSALAIIKKMQANEIRVHGNFISYEPGGSGAAYLAWLNKAPGLEEEVMQAAHMFFRDQKRTSEGLMTSRHAKEELDQIFIDVAFAVTPFLLYTGLKTGNQEYIDFAVFETLELFRILEDKSNGLLHQARGFTGKGILSEDNWSRGNGWGAFALAILVRDLPESHPLHSEVINLAKKYFGAVLKFQNKSGLWHQEMSEPASFTETSGSGLMLYGLGIMLERKVLPPKYRKNFIIGLRGLLDYIGPDGSVSHTSVGTLNPGKGTKQEYINRRWELNDAHAFGPVVLAFTQAIKLGILEIEPLNKLGHYVENTNTGNPGTYVTHARGSDVAWENDRIAFRVFGPEVRGRVKSGIDVWAKSVEYPVLEKWYKLNEEGYDYHTDRGEGCDFYNMGNRSGSGAVAIWIDEKPYLAETYDTYKIIENEKNKIRFELQYKTWNIPGLNISEEKTIEMIPGTNLFRVTSTFKSDTNKEISVAIGLSGFGNPEIFKDSKRGVLSLWEKVEPGHGNLGTAILADPKTVTGFASFNNDEFVLLKVKTNAAFTYYAGAGWDKSLHFNKKSDWEKYLLAEAKKVKF